jgi:hypothetical protein
MTADQIKNFDEDYLHMYVPEFAKDADEFEQLWLTFCYGVSQAGGPTNKYEFYSKDMGWAVGTNLTAHHLCMDMNRKYGKYILHHTITGAASNFFWVNQEFEMVEVYIKKPLAQRIWIHLFNQLWTRDGFNKLLFDRTNHKPSAHQRRWSETGQGYYQHEQNFRKVKHLLTPEANGIPRYLKPKLHGNKLSNNGKGPAPIYM